MIVVSAQAAAGIGSTVRQDLVSRAQSGDQDAFSDLVRPSFSRLLGAARLILRDPDRAEDAVQEALVLAWRDIRAIREPDAWDAWLYRLTVRACYRWARRQRQRDVRELPVFRAVDSATEHDFSTTIVERDRLGGHISRLPLDQRTVMVMHFYLDLPLGDAAAILGIPVGTAKSRLHRGLEALRIAMGPERPDLVGAPPARGRQP
jgi:RNA polymerase sigma-70 factor, ECF subfamily